MGQKVLIVGVTGGVGSALAGHAIDAGAEVYGVGRKADISLEGLAAYINSEDITTAVQHIPDDIDVVIIATGFLHDDTLFPEKKLTDVQPQNLNKNYIINAQLPIMWAQAIASKLNKNGAVFASLSARVGSVSDNKLGGWYSYRMSKAALNMGLKTLSIEWARTLPNTIVLGVHPGTVATALSAPFQKNVSAEKLFTPEQSAAYLWGVIGRSCLADSGKIFAWDGQEIAP